MKQWLEVTVRIEIATLTAQPEVLEESRTGSEMSAQLLVFTRQFLRRQLKGHHRQNGDGTQAVNVGPIGRVKILFHQALKMP